MTIETTNQFTDAEGEVFEARPNTYEGQETIVLGVGGARIEFFASDAERIIDLIREAAK